MEQKTIDTDTAINTLKLQRNAALDHIAILEGRVAWLEAELLKSQGGLKPPPRS